LVSFLQDAGQGAKQDPIQNQEDDEDKDNGRHTLEKEVSDLSEDLFHD
jgi:hypothetical protein